MNTKNLRKIFKSAPLKQPPAELDARIESLFAAASKTTSLRHLWIRILSIAAGIAIVTVLLFIMHGEPKTERHETNENSNVPNEPLCRKVFVHAEKIDHIFEQEISSVRFVETKI